MNSSAQQQDMNSTPIGKLPPPPIMGMDSASSGGNYQDILKNIELARSTPIQPSLVPAPSSGDMSPQNAGDYRDALTQLQQQTYQHQAMQNQAAQQTQAMRQVRRTRRPKKKSGIDLKALRPGLIVAAIIFMVLSKGAPMIATKLPFSVDAVTGKFTMMGLLLVSLVSGGVYLGITELLKRYAKTSTAVDDDEYDD